MNIVNSKFTRYIKSKCFFSLSKICLINPPTDMKKNIINNKILIITRITPKEIPAPPISIKTKAKIRTTNVNTVNNKNLRKNLTGFLLPKTITP